MAFEKLLKQKKTRKPGEPAPFKFDRLDAFDADDPIMSLYRRAIDAVQQGKSDNESKRMRYFVMAQLAASAFARHPSLEAAECGCFRGHSTYMIATLMREAKVAGALHVFDSFEGLSEFRQEDFNAYQTTEESREKRRRQFAAAEDFVADNLKSFEFVKLYKGWIPERFGEVEDKKFSFVSIDVDMHQPTFDSLAFFYPRLAEGGTMFFDDYGSKNFPGARKAIDDYLATQPAPSFFMRMPFGSAILQK